MIKNIIIDLSYFMVQRGYIFKDLKYNGKSTGIYYGVLKLVYGLCKQYPECNILICRDGFPYAKREMYPAYKVNRDEVDYKPSKDFCLIKNLQKMLVTYPKVTIWYEVDREADDLIASLALVNPKESIVLSGDNDFLQLLNKGVRISKSVKDNKFEFRTEEYIQQKYGVTKDKLLAFRVLQGDKSDNISGILSTRQIKSIIDEDLKKLIESLTEEQLSLFKRNLSLMSLTQFQKNPIHKKSLKITPESSLFREFGLEKLMWNN